MNSFYMLFQKEWTESWKDGKLFWLPAVLILLGLIQPLSLYYMPQIIDMAGNLPEGAVIDIPRPRSEEVMASTLSQFSTVGTAIFVFSVMGSIVNERNQGSLSLVMARPVSPLQYIGSKWLQHVLLVLASFAVSYGLAFYYTNLLFGKVELERFLFSLSVYSIWIIFVMSVAMFFSALFRHIGGIAGMSISFIAFVSLAGSLFPRFTEWMPDKAKSQADYFIMHGSWDHAFGWMVFSSAGIVFLLFMCTVFVFKKYESY
ncbi:ABC transporter permease subunit [Bacillus sonorensis]|uniref:ABC transporter permease YxlG n=2 Tax=Bacillus sonorensis TaxID=119858 RepID=M5P2K2_9BACI|nr:MULTISPECIES: ABC transporter permease subunit [Bacillus]TWK80905.1 putative transmembrane protein YxlG [Bacillus paralicheniformis]ASB86838.1 putative transmembrane protein YxlG [Bacillus sonorensis]EME73669.1 ABC transporter permease YxlG [Bacillus sonorensis L12]MBG9914632.1 membrane protein [Bacillus sonorensis]MCF7616091.1 ABC transporter permease subunit [Bacillus sonorensis]